MATTRGHSNCSALCVLTYGAWPFHGLARGPVLMPAIVPWRRAVPIMREPRRCDHSGAVVLPHVKLLVLGCLVSGGAGSGTPPEGCHFQNLQAHMPKVPRV